MIARPTLAAAAAARQAVKARLVQQIDTGACKRLAARLDIINLLDLKYRIRNGTGIGVRAPQFGSRRALLAGLTQRLSTAINETSTGEEMPPAANISIVALFLHADIVVKGVLLLLLASSIWSWAVIVDKLRRFGAARRAVGAHEARAAAAHSAQELWNGAADPGDPAAQVLAAGRQEWAVEMSANFETVGERRERVERAMRLALTGEMRRLETNLPFLATLGSAAPFIGLFGTVWGIMRSFAGIAAANNTSLAVVAPGIAEALFATAMGLAAAIPAVVAYNKLTVDLGRLAGRVQTLIGRSGALVARAGGA